MLININMLVRLPSEVTGDMMTALRDTLASQSPAAPPRLPNLHSHLCIPPLQGPRWAPLCAPVMAERLPVALLRPPSEPRRLYPILSSCLSFKIRAFSINPLAPS